MAGDDVERASADALSSTEDRRELVIAEKRLANHFLGRPNSQGRRNSGRNAQNIHIPQSNEQVFAILP